MADVTTHRRLVLLTNQYPYAQGDHVFLSNEIGALASRFDEIEVFNYTHGSPGEMVQMPANVVYGGNLYGASRTEKIKALVSPALLLRSATVAKAEFRAGRLHGHLQRFAAAAAVGMTLANDARLRRALSHPNAETTIYSFWGMGAGLVLPWIPSGVRRVSLRLHRYDLYEEESGYLPFRPALFQRAEQILAISESARRYLLTKYPEEKLAGKIKVRRLGTAQPLPSNGALVNRPGHTIVSCSNLIPVKRVERILSALEQVPLEEPLTWIHFGGGVLEEELRAKAASVNRPGLTIEIRGSTPHEQVMDYYRTHKIAVFINVSESEGLPVSIMEAISHDIPVIATNVGGTAEIVGAELKTGEIIASDFTTETLCQRLLQVISAAPGTYSPKGMWMKNYDAAANAEAAASLISD